MYLTAIKTLMAVVVAAAVVVVVVITTVAAAAAVVVVGEESTHTRADMTTLNFNIIVNLLLGLINK
jgi:hypothetical protein